MRRQYTDETKRDTFLTSLKKGKPKQFDQKGPEDLIVFIDYEHFSFLWMESKHWFVILPADDNYLVGNKITIGGHFPLANNGK